MPTLEQNFAALSPRLSPPRRFLVGPLIWTLAVALFVALFAQAFVQTGIAAWAVGLVYILYDTALVGFVARKTRTMADAPAMHDARPLSLTAVIAAYNEAPVIVATVEALRRQSPPPDTIIIADDGSGDDTAAVLNAAYGLAQPAPGMVNAGNCVSWLRLPRGGKAQTLNTAIGMIDTDLIVTVDADTLLEDGALAAMHGAFAREDTLVAATGVLHPVCPPTLSGRVFQWFQTYEYVRNFLSRYAWMETNSLLLISGAFAGFRRDALVRVGGFDPDSLVEDYEVMHRMHRFGRDHALGWQVRVIGEAQATTDSPASLLTFLRQRRRWFAGFLQTQYWNRDMIGNRRYGALGTAMLPVKALDTVQPLYGLAAFAVLVAFLVTGTFAIVVPVIIAMAVKVVIDLVWLLWSLRLYRRWTGKRIGAGGALLAAVVEPFTFQLLRHAGAAWGWFVFLTGRQVWGTTTRTALAADAHDRAAGSIA